MRRDKRAEEGRGQAPGASYKQVEYQRRDGVTNHRVFHKSRIPYPWGYRRVREAPPQPHAGSSPAAVQRSRCGSKQSPPFAKSHSPAREFMQDYSDGFCTSI